MGLIQVSLRPFRADPFIGRFPGLKPRAESRSPPSGHKTSPKSAYLRAIQVSVAADCGNAGGVSQDTYLQCRSFSQAFQKEQAAFSKIQ